MRRDGPHGEACGFRLARAERTLVRARTRRLPADARVRGADHERWSRSNDPPMPASPLTRLRNVCLALPEAHEVEAWGEPTFRVRNKLFATYATVSRHHGKGRVAVWCKAAPGNQALMVRAAPERFFVPPYVGPSGWVGVWLDREVDWRELAELVRDSYRLVAPKRLVALLDEA